MKNKRAAIELSIGTIIIIVLGVTMLVLGMVLVRAVMCSAIGLTEETGKKASAELEKYFEEKSEEIVCVGQEAAVKMVPDSESDSIIFCAVQASATAKYTFKITDYGSSEGIKKEQIAKWIKQAESEYTISPGDTQRKKTARLRIPDNSPIGNIWLKLEIKRDGEIVSTKTLDFDVTRKGFVRATMC